MVHHPRLLQRNRYWSYCTADGWASAYSSHYAQSSHPLIPQCTRCHCCVSSHYAPNGHIPCGHPWVLARRVYGGYPDWWPELIATSLPYGVIRTSSHLYCLDPCYLAICFWIFPSRTISPLDSRPPPSPKGKLLKPTVHPSDCSFFFPASCLILPLWIHGHFFTLYSPVLSLGNILFLVTTTHSFQCSNMMV